MNHLNLFGGAAFAVAAFLPGVASANLVVNGDFSAGNSGFQTDYTLVAANGTVGTVPPQYGISTNPSTDFTNGYDSYGDHTTGTGQMLLVDGSGNANQSFWRELIALAGNTEYTFSYWVTGADSTSLPTLQFDVNGVPEDAGIAVLGDGGGAWQQITDSFVTTAAGTYTLALFDLNTVALGNDFTVDDISLDEVPPSPPGVPEPASLAILGVGLAGLRLVRRKKA